MANANRGLGRGLGALLGDAALQTESADSLYLPISQVESCAGQPRKHFDDAALADLADSICEHGIIQPLTVRKLASGYYQIIAGERRWRAARLAGLTQVPAIVIEADDRKAMELALIENLQREDLNPIEEAEGYKTLIETYHMTQEDAAATVGKSRPAVANAMRLLTLDESVREAVKDGRLVALAARGERKGYAGPVQALVGLDVDGKIRAVLITKQNETPGLGANVCERKFKKTIYNLFQKRPEGIAPNAFLDQFDGKSAAKGVTWKVKKDGGNIDYVTGATVTSRTITALTDEIAQCYLANREEIIRKLAPSGGNK